MLLMDSESGSSEGGRRRGEDRGGGSHTPSSIQDTRWGVGGSSVLLVGREVDGVERGERLAVLVLEEVMEEVAEEVAEEEVESLLGLLRTTPPGEASVEAQEAESADWALVRPGEVGGNSEKLK